MKLKVFFIILSFILALGLWQSVFIVDQREKALVLELGKPVSEALGPGLHFKLPFIQNVIYFDARVLEYDAPPAEILTQDKKNLVVDNYSRWRIKDPLKFYQSVRTVNQGISRIDDIVYAELRVALGQYLLTEVVSSKRAEIMERVTQKCDELLANYGIEVLDVRIKRADLPPENEKAVYNRMRAERERQAKTYRSEGREEATKIRAQADKERTIMLAEAKQKAEQLKGEGEAEATLIYANALEQDSEFYQFTRSLEAYKQSLSKDTELVLTPNSEFFKYLKSSK
ncbi:MAG: HflC protein [Desulfonauticus sp. 38_4375]|nr:MAG: HflC protein [Desulfonauticus sp. 38_4375]